MGRRTYFNRATEINYPSRVEGWLDVCETEGELTRKQKITLPWGPLYCVLQQDEQSFTAYCSEEISIFSATPKKELTDIMCNEYPRVRLDRIRRTTKIMWDGPPTLQEEEEDSEDTCPMDIALNTTLYSDLDFLWGYVIFLLGTPVYFTLTREQYVRFRPTKQQQMHDKIAF